MRCLKEDRQLSQVGVVVTVTAGMPQGLKGF